MRTCQRAGNTGRVVYHHEQRVKVGEVRAGDIIVMPGSVGVTAWEVMSVTDHIAIIPFRARRKKERSQNNEQ